MCCGFRFCLAVTGLAADLEERLRERVAAQVDRSALQHQHRRIQVSRDQNHYYAHRQGYRLGRPFTTYIRY